MNGLTTKLANTKFDSKDELANAKAEHAQVREGPSHRQDMVRKDEQP